LTQTLTLVTLIYTNFDIGNFDWANNDNGSLANSLNVYSDQDCCHFAIQDQLSKIQKNKKKLRVTGMSNVSESKVCSIQ